MKLFFLLLFGAVNIQNFDEVKNFVQNSKQMEQVTHQLKYISDGEERLNSCKPPEKTLSDGGGDCEDFAILVFETLKEKGYDVALFFCYNEKEGHAICWYRKGKDEGYFSNQYRYQRKNFSILRYCEIYMWQYCELMDAVIQPKHRRYNLKGRINE